MIELRNPIVSGNASPVRLALAFILSFAIHAAVVGAGLIDLSPKAKRQAPEPLQATLVPAVLPPPPTLIAPEAPQPRSESAVQQPENTPKPPSRPTQAVRPSHAGFTAADFARMALKQIAQQPFYPEEAVARGLQGEVLVRLFLDESGNAIAARLERGSGYTILDDAAVRAAGKVRALPAGAPSELLLPVRFRLR